MDGPLQAEMRERVEETRKRSNLACPDGDANCAVECFYFVSPSWTWTALCGRAGIVGFCDTHKRQLAFFGELMN